MAMAMFILTAMDAAVKWIINDYSIQQVNLVRSIVAMIVLFPTIQTGGGLRLLATKRPLIHLWRAALMVTISYVWFFALGRMMLADLGAIVMIAPLIITALSPFVLKEKVGWRRWLAVIVGFFGMIIVVRPGSGVFNPIAIMAVCVALGYALLILSNRANHAIESLASLVYYPLIGIFVVSAFLAPLDWVQPTGLVWGIMMLIGIFAAAGHLCLTLAARYASPPVLAPFEYTGLIWAIVLGYFLFQELPDFFTFLGIFLILIAGVFIVYAESQGDADL
jgi:drug/metabolite transporter (DMT)-like permease